MAIQQNAHAGIVAVSTKHNYRRAVPKTYSYRYEVVADTGPQDEPLVRAGAAIIEGHYRGRNAVFNVARSVVEPESYVARGGYIHPLDDNPMAYPPRAVEQPAAQTPTPGFPASSVAKVMRAGASRFGSAAAAAAAKTPPSPAQIKRRESPHATPANEPASFRKTG